MKRRPLGALKQRPQSRKAVTESYAELQGLPTLESARKSNPLAPAGFPSTERALFQSAEVAILNIVDLIQRATANVSQERVGDALVKWEWALGFHCIVLALGQARHKISPAPGCLDRPAVDIRQSPTFEVYCDAVRDFDASTESWDIKTILANQTIDNPALRILHLARYCAHESIEWTRLLGITPTSGCKDCFLSLVNPVSIRKAVFERTLEGDTFFTQFRGYHQIAEILAAEINDRIEASIRALNESNIPNAHLHLSVVLPLMDAMLAGVAWIGLNLTARDYHKIRESLGLTSGSHSVALHYHLFRDLFNQLWTATAETACRLTGIRASNPRAWIKKLSEIRLQNANTALAGEILDGCRNLNLALDHWRHLHLHMPRNVLGAQARSLVGARDAVTQATRFRDHALRLNPMAVLDWGLRGSDDNPLAEWLANERSLDRRLLTCTGELTNKAFPDVQFRTNSFAKKPKFTPPPSRKV